MAYSDMALAFSVLPVGHQVRLEDRVSFAYLERCVIVQDRTGVIGLREDDDGNAERIKVQLPVAGLAVLALGPGTSITQPAVTSCTRSGTTVLFCGGGGVPAYCLATPLSSSARWAIAQAKLVSDEQAVREAAVVWYRRQLGMEMVPNASIKAMRGIEGRVIRTQYSTLAKKYKVKGFRRDVKALDSVNVALNLCNAILYGCAASACSALGVNPALGIIHRGDARSLLYDLADLYKPSVSLPAAFEASLADEPTKQARRLLRKAIVQEKMLSGMLDMLMQVLSPHLPGREGDRLIDDGGEVVGHRQYADEADDPEFSFLPNDAVPPF